MSKPNWDCYPEHLRPSNPPDPPEHVGDMSAPEIIMTAIEAANALLISDQSGSATSFREAEKAAKTVLSAWVTIQSDHVRAMNELNKWALLIREESDRNGIFRVVHEIGQEISNGS